MKVLPPEFADSPDRRTRFEKEAKAAGMINHPNVLAVHDFGVDQGVPCVVMEYLEGNTLRTVLAKGPLPWRKAADIGLHLSKGLERLVLRCLEKEPQHRFKTAEDLAFALDLFSGTSKRDARRRRRLRGRFVRRVLLSGVPSVLALSAILLWVFVSVRRETDAPT